MNASELVSAAAVFLDQGDLDAAIGAAEAATLLDPDSALAWAALGNALARAKKLERAAECFDEAIDIDPDDLANYVSLGEVLLDIGAYKLAAEFLDEACKRDTTGATPAGRRARVLIAKALGALRKM